MSYIIETNELVKRFGYKAAVDHVSIHLEPGEIYGLIGKNGAGKTTLLKLLLGFLRPTEGSMTIFGSNNVQSARTKIGSLIEAPGLYKSKTARENLILFATLYGAPLNEVDDLLKLVGLENTGAKKVKAFSLGMKQRLGLAVALLGKPEILLLDEPVNGLDPAGIKQFRDIVVELHQQRNVTFIISSHLLDELGKVATKYGIIRDGKMIEEKTIEEIQSICGTFLKIKTNDNEKALKVIKDNFNGIEAKIVDDYIALKDCESERSKINKVLINNDLDVDEVNVEMNDVESFFVERLG